MGLLKTLTVLLVIQVTNAQFQGNPIKSGEFPFYVLVETITASGSKFWCSGALVNNKYVITNAHCLYRFDSNKPNVIVGGNSHVDKKAKIIRTNETFIHTDYKFDTDEHDIAVVRLNWKVEFSPFVRAVNLLKFNEVDENTEIMLVGYRRESSSGGPRVRFSIVLETSKPVCEYKLKRAYLATALLQGSRFCIADDDLYTVQHGDILFQRNGDSVVLIGLVSANNIFNTRVSALHDEWIVNLMDDGKQEENSIVQDINEETKVKVENVLTTKEELTNLFRDLLNNDVNNAFEYIDIFETGILPIDYIIGYTVKPEAFEIPTIKSFLSIYQKYYQKSGVEKIETKVELNDQNLLIETFLNTTVLSTAMGFLGEKGFVKNDFDEYKKSLRNLWFEPYNAFVHRFFGHRTPRFSTPDYSKGRTFSNWITMHLEEKKQKMVKNVSPMMTQSLKSYNGENTAITFHFYKIFGNQTLESLPTKTMCILLGTSPELEMALYTVCAYMSLNGHCNIVDFIASENNISWLNVTCAVD